MNWKKLLVILGVSVLIALLGWALIVIAEGFIELFSGLPDLWKSFLEAVRQLGEAWRGNNPP